MLHNRFRQFLLAGIAFVALPGHGLAQESQVADAGGDKFASVETVLITARHTEERAQDVPISISVVTDQTLQQTGGYTLADIQHTIPGLVAYNSNPRNSSIGIRGLGVTSAQDGLDTSVGVYVDGVYFGRPGMALQDLIDVSQIEVLRGPQGTLFGRNSSAGVVNIATKAPSFDSSLTAEASFGSYTYNQERVTATGALIDDLVAFRLTAYNTYRDGVTPNTTTGGRDNGIGRSGGRAQLLITPNSDLSIRIIGDYSVEDDTANGSVLTAILPDSAGAATAHTKTALAATGWTPVANPYATATNAIHNMRTRQGGGSLQADYNLGWADVTSISAVRLWEFWPLQDSDSVPLDILQVNVAKTRDTQATQEFRLTSKPGAFTWQTGVFLFHQNLRDHYILNQYGYDAGAFLTNYARTTNPVAPAVIVTPGAQYIDDVRTTTDSVAVFGQVNWEIFDGFTVTGGLRYTHDWRAGTAISSVIGTIPAARTPAINDDLSISGSDVSGLASVAYKIADDSLLYGSFSTGYKAAGLNLDSAVPTSGLILKPELTTNYELGIKQGLLDDRLSVNADVYWTVVRGLQANYYPLDGSKSYLTNVGHVRARGVEAEVDYQVDENFSFGVNGAFNEAVYSSYPGAPCPIGVTGICDLTGRPVYQAPKWVGNANATYGWDYSSDVHPYVSAQYSYTSTYNGTIDDSPQTQIKGYGLLNLRAGATFGNGKYEAIAWANNVFDKHYYTSASAVSQPGAGTFAISQAPGVPLTLGATLRVNL